jgi:hypothetical protein
LSFGRAPAEELPAFYIRKLEDMPDLLQSNARLPGNGSTYCGPVSASNSLVWLSRNGYKALMPGVGDDSQLRVAGVLGSEAYMNASLKNGTDVRRFIKGIRKYIEDKGMAARVLHQGWRCHTEASSHAEDVPTLEFIKSGVLGKNVAFLNIGWYTYNEQSDAYRRFSGHWLSVAGYGKDENGLENRSTIIACDPAPRAGYARDFEYIELAPIRSGRLIGKYRGLPRSARGFFKLEGGMHLNPLADVAILDSVVAVMLDRPEGTEPLDTQ